MIISGGSRSNWQYFAKHLMRTDENERVHIVEIKDLVAGTVRDALREMDAIAMGTRVSNFFYHADINPREGEELTPEQWEQAVATLEQNLGLEGQPRLVVEHEKKGRTHRHVVWLRVDLDTMKAIPDSWDYSKHQKTSRTLEQEFGLEPAGGVLGPDGKRKKRRPKNYEVQRGDVSGITTEEVTREVTALWLRADTGKALAAALAERGYILAKGDQRDYVIVDRAGDEHSLARRVEGARAADIRERMKDVDRAALPSVDAARALARERAQAARDTEAAAAPRDPGDSQANARQPEEATAPPAPAESARRQEPQRDAPAVTRDAAETSAPEAELTEAERFIRDRKRAVREGEASTGDAQRWVEKRSGQKPSEPSPLPEKPTEAQRFIHARKRALRAGGGEPYRGDHLSFGMRSAATLKYFGDRLAQWARGTWQDWVSGRFKLARNDKDHDKFGMER